MTKGENIVRHFDLVCYILKKYRTMMITEIADIFLMNVMDVYEVYDALGIDPLEIVVKNYKETVFTSNNDIKSNGQKPAKPEKHTHTVQYLHIKPSDKVPNREPVEKKFERPPANYTNLPSPLGIASELKKGDAKSTEETNASNEENI